jgi:membrane protein required for beta-lactamase induction
MLGLVALRAGQLDEAARLADSAERAREQAADQVRQARDLVAAAAARS